MPTSGVFRLWLETSCFRTNRTRHKRTKTNKEDAFFHELKVSYDEWSSASYPLYRDESWAPDESSRTHAQAPPRTWGAKTNYTRCSSLALIQRGGRHTLRRGLHDAQRTERGRSARTSSRRRKVDERVRRGSCRLALNGGVLVELQGVRPGVLEMDRFFAISYDVGEGQGPVLIGKAVGRRRKSMGGGSYLWLSVVNRPLLLCPFLKGALRGWREGQALTFQPCRRLRVDITSGFFLSLKLSRTPLNVFFLR